MKYFCVLNVRPECLVLTQSSFRSTCLSSMCVKFHLHFFTQANIF